MSKTDIKIPSFVRYNDKLLRIVEITCVRDNSMYFLPRKKGYILEIISEKIL